MVRGTWYMVHVIISFYGKKEPQTIMVEGYRRNGNSFARNLCFKDMGGLPPYQKWKHRSFLP
jgi:hypothetical protein